MSSQRAWTLATAVAVFVLALVLSRTLLAPKYLYFFDSVNFALALDDFNPALHQPQPPGYPLFVLLAKAIFAFAGDAQKALVLAGVVGSAVTVAIVWKLGFELFGARPALFAALILLFNPPFWFGGLTNQVRIFLAVAGAAILYTAWRSVREQSTSWFYLTAVLIGVLSGFRPDTLFFAVPLLGYVGLRRRARLSHWTVAIALMGGTTAAWALVVVREVGGVTAMMDLLRAYSEDQFRTTSVVFGADTQPAFRMFLKAAIWYGVPVLTWLVVAPFARGVFPRLRSSAGLLACAVLPAFAFHSLIHVGDPDHTLFAVPALCLIGGLVVSHVRWSPIVAVAVMALNVAVFFHPPKGIAEACSYGAVRHSDVITRETFREIAEVRRQGPIHIIVHDHHVSWRHLYYYYRDVPLLVLHQDPRQNPEPTSAWLLYNRQVLKPALPTGELELPAGRSVWLLSHGRGMHKLLGETVPLMQPSPFIAYSETAAGSRFQFGGYRFSGKTATQVVKSQPPARTAPM